MLGFTPFVSRLFLESDFKDPCPTLDGTRRVTMPHWQVVTSRRGPAPFRAHAADAHLPMPLAWPIPRPIKDDPVPLFGRQLWKPAPSPATGRCCAAAWPPSRLVSCFLFLGFGEHRLRSSTIQPRTALCHHQEPSGPVHRWCSRSRLSTRG